MGEDLFYKRLGDFVKQYSHIGPDDDVIRITNLPYEFMKSITSHLMISPNNRQKTDTDFHHDEAVVHCLGILARNRNNIADLSSRHSYVKHMYDLVQPLLWQTSVPLVGIVTSYLSLLESLYDPYRRWQNRISGHVQILAEIVEPAHLDTCIVSLISEAFNIPHLSLDTKYKIVSLLGCIICGSKKNALLVITPAVLDTLKQALTADEFFLLKNPLALRRQILMCFVLMVHTLHDAEPGERQLEVDAVAESLFQILDEFRQNKKNVTQNPDIHADLFDAVREMVSNQRDLAGLQASFMSIHAFHRILAFLECFDMAVGREEVLTTLAVAVIRALHALLLRSLVAKEQFIQSGCHVRLLSGLQRLGQPRHPLLLALLDMAVENTFDERQLQRIANPVVIELILKWIPILNDQLQVKLAKTVAALCTKSDKNRMTCCENGLLMAVIETLRCSIQSLKQSVHLQGVLIQLIEQLGVLSITAAEVKQLIALLNVEASTNLCSFSARIISALIYMSQQHSSERALHYFSLPETYSAIDIPGDRTADMIKSGFTVHAWICLDLSYKYTGTRRVLYRICASSGGFEGFISSDGMLHVAELKKEQGYHAFSAKTDSLLDGKWHMVTIVHKSEWRKWRVSIYVDSQLCQSCNMPALSLDGSVAYQIGERKRESEDRNMSPLQGSHPRSGVLGVLGGLIALPHSGRVDAQLIHITDGQQDLQFGIPVGIHGDVGTVCLFKCCVSDVQIKNIYAKGTNGMEILSDDPQLEKHLMFHLNAKMCVGMTCLDLSENKKDCRLIDGHPCMVHDIKDVIQSIGGVQVFIPILQNANRSLTDVDLDLATILQEKYGTSDIALLCKNPVAGFFNLLRSFINEHDLNREDLLHTNSLPIIGALLQQEVDGQLIDLDTYISIRRLLEDLNERGPDLSLRNAILQNLFLDFRVWKGASLEMRFIHAHYLLELVQTQSDRSLFRKKYGVQYILDTIREFFSNPTEESDDILKIRQCLFRILRLYIRNDITKDELNALLNFILSVDNHQLMSEALQAVNRLLDRGGSNDQIYLLMHENDAAILLYDLITRDVSSPVGAQLNAVPAEIKHLALQTLVKIVSTDKVAEKNKVSLRLEEFSCGGLVSLLHPIRSEDELLVPLLLDLACQPITREPHYRNIVHILSLSSNVSLSCKVMVARKLAGILDARSSALTGMTKVQGWQESVASLLYQKADYCREPQFALDTQSSDSDNSDDSPFVIVTVVPNEEPPMFTMVRSPSPVVINPGTLNMPTPHRSHLPSANSSFDTLSSPKDVLNVLMNNEATSNSQVPAESSTVCDLCNIVLSIHCKLFWKGLVGGSDAIWKERMKLFLSLGGERTSLMVDRVAYQRQLLESLVKTCAEEVSDVAPAEVASTNNGLQVVKLVMDFTTRWAAKSDEDGFSVELLEHTLKLISEKMSCWNPLTRWEEVGNIGVNLLLLYACRSSSMLCSIFASTKIHHLVLEHEAITDLGEICFVLHSVNEKLLDCMVSQDKPSFSHQLQVLRAILINYSELLDTGSKLPLAPVLKGNQHVEEEFETYCSTQEWKDFISGFVQDHKCRHIRKLKELESDLKNLWNEVEDGFHTDYHLKCRERGESKLKYREKVECLAKERRDGERKREEMQRAIRKRNLQLDLEQWQARMQFFQSKSGTWSSPVIKPIYWMMSTHENFSRMRLKLVPNMHFDDHMAASLARDRDDTGLAQPVEPSLLPVGLTTDAAEDDEPAPEPAAPEPRLSEIVNVESRKEELMLRVNCDRMTMVDPIHGRLEITTKSIYFFDSSQNDIGADFSWPLSALRDLHCRLRSLQRTALEFFLIDQTNYFLNFSKEDRKEVIRTLTKLKRGDPKFKIYGNTSKLDSMLKTSGLVQKWTRREISNFDYLMQLNTIAGRTYNDWSQYPVFPWVLCDYTSAKLDLSDPKVYRDLSKPTGALNPENAERVRERYMEFSDPTGQHKAFHHGIHYSTAAGVVMHFLLRMEPFTTQHIWLQGGQFDKADRQFRSIEASLMSQLKGNDCKELIPEFFCQPEFLMNLNGFNLGILQGTNTPINDVVLPPWASSADDFIWKHRKALESEEVSRTLHHWIDLVFGYKQRGPAAEEALNVFPAHTYEGSYDLDQLKPEDRLLIEQFINNFGQTPSQLLKEPHPPRRSMDDCLKILIDENRPVSLLHFLKGLTCFYTDVYEAESAGSIVLACVPHHQVRPPTGAAYDTLVTISDKGVVGLHKWLPYDTQITNKFEFHKDHTVDRPRPKCLRGAFAPSVRWEPKLFAVSGDAELIFSGGHWDNSLRVYNPRKDSVIKLVAAHNGVVTCLDLDAAGERLVTGSADTTCKIWQVTRAGVGDKPLYCLYGHDDEVTCVAISSEYDMVVSGSKDGTILTHTVHKGLFVRMVQLPHSVPGSVVIVAALALSHLGHIVVYTEESSENSPQQISKCLHLYSLNGRYLCKQELDHPLSHMVTAQDYLIYGNTKGHLCILELFGFQEVDKPLRLDRCIRTISFTRGFSHILVGLDGSPGKLIVVVRNAPPQIRPSILTSVSGLLT